MATLNSSARNAIVAAFSQAMDGVENSGNLITQVCEVANKQTKGEAVSKDDADAIIESIADKRGWKDKTLTARSSEIRVVLKASPSLPETIKLMQSRAKRCDWHVAMKLARRINKGESCKDAVMGLLQDAEGASKKINPAGKAAGALSFWYKHAKGDKRAAIVKAAGILGLELRGIE